MSAVQPTAPGRRSPIGESDAVRNLLVALSVGILVCVLLLPLALIFSMALREGWAVYAAAITDPAALAAVRLTAITALVVVPLSVLYGVAAAWAIARHRFRGKSILVTLIDLPFAVPPVIAGMVFVLLFGAHGWLGPWLIERGWKIVFAWPGIFLATAFVVSPFVARELVPVLQARGTAEEEAALTLGAGPWTMFWRVSLPKMRWGIAYGTILCAARAIGEFGAVSVVSGHIRGRTTTLPLHVEMTYNEYQFTAAFAVASLLTGIALVSLVLQLAIKRGRARGN